jgi:hypothetical protein
MVDDPALESQLAVGQSSWSCPILHHWEHTLAPLMPFAQTSPGLQSLVDEHDAPAAPEPAAMQFVVPATPSDDTMQLASSPQAPNAGSAAPFVGSIGLHCCVHALKPGKGLFVAMSTTW